MNARSAHHGDGIVLGLGQIGNGQRTHLVLHRNEAKAAAASRDAIDYQADLLYLAIRGKEGVEIRLADVVSQIRHKELPLYALCGRILTDEGWLSVHGCWW